MRLAQRASKIDFATFAAFALCATAIYDGISAVNDSSVFTSAGRFLIVSLLSRVAHSAIILRLSSGGGRQDIVVHCAAVIAAVPAATLLLSYVLEGRYALWASDFPALFALTISSLAVLIMHSGQAGMRRIAGFLLATTVGVVVASLLYYLHVFCYGSKDSFVHIHALMALLLSCVALLEVGGPWRQTESPPGDRIDA